MRTSPTAFTGCRFCVISRAAIPPGVIGPIVRRLMKRPLNSRKCFIESASWYEAIECSIAEAIPLQACYVANCGLTESVQERHYQSFRNYRSSPTGRSRFDGKGQLQFT